jgi:hypothetical protein
MFSTAKYTMHLFQRRGARSTVQELTCSTDLTNADIPPCERARRRIRVTKSKEEGNFICVRLAEHGASAQLRNGPHMGGTRSTRGYKQEMHSLLK